MPGLFDPAAQLVEIVVLGKTLEVPEKNLLLRQLQFVAPEVASGRYCWNGECRYCEIGNYPLAPRGPELTGLACLVKGLAGISVTRLSAEVRYNLRDPLAAPREHDSPAHTPPPARAESGAPAPGARSS